jgi:transcriptional regulator with XRE-family HTH domain
MVVPSDPEAISRIVDVLLARSGMSLAEAARRLGVANQSLHQYKKGKRKKTSLQWLQRLTEICGAKILIEMPPDRLGDRL